MASPLPRLLSAVGRSALESLLARLATPAETGAVTRPPPLIAEGSAGATGRSVANGPAAAPPSGWAALIEDLNRLPRPALALGVVGLMAWAPTNPEGFAQAMAAYDTMPDWLAGALCGIAAIALAARPVTGRSAPRSDAPAGETAVFRSPDPTDARPPLAGPPPPASLAPLGPAPAHPPTAGAAATPPTPSPPPPSPPDTVTNPSLRAWQATQSPV